jgi:SAM-dependent methyltransferase
MSGRCDSFRALGFFRNHRKGRVVKNLAGALHANRIGCTLSVGGEVKMEIPAKAGFLMHELSGCPVCHAPASGATVCSTADRTYEGKPYPSRVVRCRCGHGFLNPSPDAGELMSFYDDDYHCYTTSPNEAERIGRWIEQRRDGDRFNHVPIVVGGRFLDVGCGSGDMVAAMARLGMESEGVEPSRYAATKATEAGLRVTCGLLHDAAFPDASFDVVSMFHVLEHIPEPIEVLRECRRILKPGGELVIAVPNFDSLVFALVGKSWVGLQLPSHVQYFSPNSLRRAAVRAGFAVGVMKTESFPEHVEGELTNWLRGRFLVPRRLTQRTGVLRRISARLARKGETTHRGEAIVAYLSAPSA